MLPDEQWMCLSVCPAPMRVIRSLFLPGAVSGGSGRNWQAGGLGLTKLPIILLTVLPLTPFHSVSFFFWVFV